MGKSRVEGATGRPARLPQAGLRVRRGPVMPVATPAAPAAPQPAVKLGKHAQAIRQEFGATATAERGTPRRTHFLAVPSRSICRNRNLPEIPT